MDKIEWIDIEDSANDLVGIWNHGKDTLWLEHTWSILEKENLTSFSDEIERTHVFANLIFLGVLYHEFNAAAYDEGREFSLVMHIDELEINRFRVAQIIGPDYLSDEELDEDDLYWAALQELVESKRSLIVKILFKYYKDEIGILNSFIKFTEDDSHLYDDDIGEENDYDYNRIEMEMAMQWISNGLNSIIEY